MKPPKLYPILEAARIFNIPRSVLTNGVLNQVLPTTLQYDTQGNRCRARHTVTQADAEAFYKEYLAAEQEREQNPEPATKSMVRLVDSYSHTARSRIEDRRLFRELAAYGISPADVA